MKATFILSIFSLLVLGVSFVLALVNKDWPTSGGTGFLFILQGLLCVKCYKLMQN